MDILEKAKKDFPRSELFKYWEFFQFDFRLEDGPGKYRISWTREAVCLQIQVLLDKNNIFLNTKTHDKT